MNKPNKSCAYTYSTNRFLLQSLILAVFNHLIKPVHRHSSYSCKSLLFFKLSGISILSHIPHSIFFPTISPPKLGGEGGLRGEANFSSLEQKHGEIEAWRHGCKGAAEFTLQLLCELSQPLEPGSLAVSIQPCLESAIFFILPFQNKLHVLGA